MLNLTGTLPLYRQLSQKMLERILNGEWAINSKLPSEAELCNTYGISRMTVRLALDDLQNKGYIARRQGIGSFVTKPKIEQHLASFYSFTDDIERMGYRIDKRVLRFAAASVSGIISEKLSLPPDSRVFIIERVHFCNQTPFAVESSYIPQYMCPALSLDLIEKNGLYRSLDLFDVKPDSAVETFESILLEGKYKDLLQLSGTPTGFLVNRIASHNGLPVEFCESYVSGEMVKYNVILK